MINISIPILDMKTMVVAYLITVSVISVIVCIYDKIQAKKKSLRVAEKNLFILSALGGSVAMYITMLICRHKTKHTSFMLGIPLIIALQVGAYFLLR